MKSFERLVEIVKRLRAPDGCPWDREQTHASVRGHLVEECAELLEAIDDNDAAGMREELGDLLMHIILHAEIASEEDKFTLDDVAAELGDKLIRRHPHVFGDKKAADSSEVLQIWQQVKLDEKKARAVGGPFDGIPPQLSALRYAYDVAKRADEKTLKSAHENVELSDKTMKLGRAFFDLAEYAAKEKIEPEAALRDYIMHVKRTYDAGNAAGEK